MRQQGVAQVGEQRHLGGGLAQGLDVTEQRGGAPGLKPGQHRMLFTDLGLKGFLAQHAPRMQQGVLGEDAGDGGGIEGGVGLAATAGQGKGPSVPDGAILLVDLGQPLSDAPARDDRPSVLDDALGGGMEALSLRAAVQSLRTAATDDRIHAVLLRGTVGGDGYQSGFAALREVRAALADLRAAKKPVHAYLVSPGPSDLYVTSAASSITVDPFGMVQLPGLAAEPVFFTGLLEKVGVGIQVSRVGRFKAAVEPFTRRDMSPENRQQTAQYLGDLWGEVKRGIAESRGVDTVVLQALADTAGLLLPEAARAAKLVDRVAYYDELLTELRGVSDTGRARKSRADSAREARLAEPSLERLDVQQRGDHPVHALGGLGDDRCVPGQFRVAQVLGGQQVGVALDRGERRPQVVGEHRDELGALAGHLLQPGHRLALRLERGGEVLLGLLVRGDVAHVVDNPLHGGIGDMVGRSHRHPAPRAVGVADPDLGLAGRLRVRARLAAKPVERLAVLRVNETEPLVLAGQRHLNAEDGPQPRTGPDDAAVRPGNEEAVA